jgi:steroid 5-alpha reductase family enzyme
MLMKIFTLQILCLLIVTGVLNTFANDKQLEKTLASFGYKITDIITSAGADWELRDFKMAKLIFIIAFQSELNNMQLWKTRKNVSYIFNQLRPDRIAK